MIDKADILVLGIGNLLMGDEGVGIQAVRRLEKENWPGKVDFLDGGTGGFHLLSYLEDYAHVIIIDASLDNFPEGHVRYIKPHFAADFPPTLSAHEIGLKDMIESLVLMEKWPDLHLVVISIKDLDRLDLKLSRVILESLDLVEVQVREIILSIIEQNEHLDLMIG
jgi:hydrogenase maturation protease